MYLKHLKEQIDKIQEEVWCEAEKGIGSHYTNETDRPCPPNVIISDGKRFFQIVDISATLRPGCGCWDGIKITIQAEKD